MVYKRIHTVTKTCPEDRVYFCYFSDTFDLEDLDWIPPPPPDPEHTDLLSRREYVDCFTLKVGFVCDLEDLDWIPPPPPDPEHTDLLSRREYVDCFTLKVGFVCDLEDLDWIPPPPPDPEHTDLLSRREYVDCFTLKVGFVCDLEDLDWIPPPPPDPEHTDLLSRREYVDCFTLKVGFVCDLEDLDWIPPPPPDPEHTDLLSRREYVDCFTLKVGFVCDLEDLDWIPPPPPDPEHTDLLSRREYVDCFTLKVGFVCDLEDLDWIPPPPPDPEHTDLLSRREYVDCFTLKVGFVCDLEDLDWIPPPPPDPEHTDLLSRREYVDCFTLKVGFVCDLEDFDWIPPPPPDPEHTDLFSRREYVDCFTLKHNMLNVSTNPAQYQVILDIVNNLILYVDPATKESAEKRQRLRFKLQVTSTEDLRPAIWAGQEGVRAVAARLRAAEKEAFHLQRQLTTLSEGSQPSHALQEELMAQGRLLDTAISKEKELLAAKSDELAMMISCFKEKKVQQHRQFTLSSQESSAPIARRFEVCFEEAMWRLTESDGQLGLTDLHIRNFMYTKISRINDSGEHLLEIAGLAITNLIPNSRYKSVLRAAAAAASAESGLAGERLQPAVRVLCREMAPVGGIRMKEHFEINIVPMVAQMTYVFFRAMMRYFFPGKNIDKEDKELEGEETVVSSSRASLTRPPSTNSTRPGIGQTGSASRRRGRKSGPSYTQDGDLSGVDDIEKMKERAEANNVFLYIKIPPVPFTVSYKGEKDKNIEDVENFQLVFPLLEFHDRTWTWLDLALAIKQRSKRALLQQFMKQKLLRHRFLPPAPVPVPAPQLPDEEKARIALGSLATAEKDKKKKK